MQETQITKTKYAPDTFCVVGSTPAPASTTIAALHGRLIITLVYRGESGEIVDAECNLTLDVSSDYIRSLLVGHSIYTDLDKMIETIQRGYSGVCSKGLSVCLKDAQQKIRDRMHNCPLCS